MFSAFMDKVRTGRTFSTLISERGMAIVIAIYVMMIMAIIGSAVLMVSANDGRIVSSERKTNQALTIAENGAEHMIWRHVQPVSSGGVAINYTTTSNDATTVKAALAGSGYTSYNVLDSSNNKIGQARIVVQTSSLGSVAEKRITSEGRYCLDPSCTQLSAPRLAQVVVQILQVPGTFYNYALFYSSLGNTASTNLSNMWLSGGLYAGLGASGTPVQVVLGDVEFHGDVYLHKGPTIPGTGTDEVRMEDGSILRTFDNLNASSLGKIEGTVMNDYNSPSTGEDKHDTDFPHVTPGTWNDRQWYRENSDKFFPSDAATNLNASQNVEFCSDSNGNIRYVTDLTSGCTSSSTLLTDGGGGPYEYGMIFVAGDVEIHGTFKGQLTFIAAGNAEGAGANAGQFTKGEINIGNQSNSGSLDGSDDLRSLRTPSGVTEEPDGDEVGGCTNGGIDPVATGTDSIGLVSFDLKVDSDDNPCFIRAIWWAKNDVQIENGCSPCPSETEVHATILEVGSQLTINGQARTLKLYYDSGLIQSLPPGVQGVAGVPTILKKSYTEVYAR